MRGRRAYCAAALPLIACSSADHGQMMPVAGSGVELAKTRGLPDDTARLRGGGVTADVTGAWKATGRSVEVAYRAQGPARVRFAGEGITGAWDRTEPEPGNVMGRPLLGGELALAPGRPRTVLVEYAAGDAPGFGDEVVVPVPMPAGPAPVRFRLAGP